ncbi:double-strand break repair protein AddB [Sphingomonas sp. CJ99]
MADRARPGLYTIPIHRAFADALADGLLRMTAKDPMALARALVLVPNNRAKRSISDAFVRASGGGLLLPRLVAIGDPELDEAAGAWFDAADADDPPPPAVDPLTRRLVLARLVEQALARAGRAVDAVEAMRLAGDLGRTLDQLLIEERDPADLDTLALPEGLSEHWERSLALFRIVVEQWPRELAQMNRIDLARRRAMLMDRLARYWRDTPPQGLVCAAGVTTAAPAIARLLRQLAELPQGMVVLPGLATEMPDDQWESLGPHRADPDTGRRQPSIETHPQFHLKLLIDRMGVGRGEFRLWRGGSEHDAAPQRSRAVATAMAPPRYTRDWIAKRPDERRLAGVSLVSLPTPADEAQAIALALREALEVPGRTAALVTPDRALARRVAAHCERWGLAIDDSAGQALSLTPVGTLLIGLAEAVAERFAPVPLLALLKHPLVRAGDQRLAWLDGARQLDRALRGPRPAPGLIGIDRHLVQDTGRPGENLVRQRAAGWWPVARDLLAPLADRTAADTMPLRPMLAALREAATALAGDAAWARAEGRCAADLFTRLEAEADLGPPLMQVGALPALLRMLFDEQSIRPPQGGHPRLSILGLLEARLQTADLMILGGLNEGVWPSRPAPDPWLAPRIRAELGLPGLERRIGLAAHDLAGALGAPEVILTRAERDATAPTIPSRFWLRLEALTADQRAAAERARAATLTGWTRAIDRAVEHRPAGRPAPAPPAAARPRRISVTEVDRLKADPYAFYARRMLRLEPLDAVDADVTAAWKGTAVHRAFELWAKEDRQHPDRLRAHAEALFLAETTHPMMRALWRPRLMEAIDWMIGQLATMQATGREVLAVEESGKIDFDGVTLSGRFDRIDQAADGGLVVIDYKTGTPPSTRAIRAGFSFQLGLIGLMLERGAFRGLAGRATGFEYWSMAKKGGTSQFGYIDSPVDPAKRDPVPVDTFVPHAAEQFGHAVREWLTGDAPFTAKLRPEYANYADYDQLMRRDEWWGRE